MHQVSTKVFKDITKIDLLGRMSKRIVIMLLLIILAGSSNAELESYLTLKWTYNTKAGITDIHITDLDGDGIKEVIAGSYDGHLYLIDEKGNLKFKYYAYCPIYSVNAADLDNDAVKEIIAGSCRPAHVVGLDGTAISKIITQNAIKSIHVGDMDNDGYNDLMLASGSVRNHKVYIFDRKSNVLFQKSIQGAYPYVLAISDLDGDGINEALIGSTYFYVFNEDGDKKWMFYTDGEVSSLVINDLDDDGKNELIVGSYPNLYVLDAEGKLRWKYKTRGMVNSIHVVDIDGDGSFEILAGSDKVYVLDKDGNLLWDYDTGSEVHKVDSGDLNLDGNKEIVVGSDKISIFNRDGVLQIEYQPYRKVVDLKVVDLEDDGKTEVVIGCLDHTLYVLAYREIYLKKREVDSLFNKAQTEYNQGDYQNAKKHIEEAKNISDRWNIGVCNETPTMCDILLLKINKKLDEKNKADALINETRVEDTIPDAVDDHRDVDTRPIEDTKPIEDYDNSREDYKNPLIILSIIGTLLILIIVISLIRRK